RRGRPAAERDRSSLRVAGAETRLGGAKTRAIDPTKQQTKEGSMTVEIPYDSNLSSDLATIYATVPDSCDILTAVRAGRAEFVEFLANSGLLREFGLSTSVVHADYEVEIHAFILGMVSAPRWSEVQTKSFLTYASHWI